MSPDLYNPLTPEEFIGPARQYAMLIRQGIKRARANDDAPLRYLINGPPGVGKSQLVKFALAELGVHPASLHRKSGTAVGIEEMAAIEQSVRLRDMFGYRAIVIEEADKITEKAQVRWLDVSDQLPPANAAFFTSNCRVEEFEVRFQRRFQVIELTGPSVDDLATLLAKWLPAGHARQIAAQSIDQRNPSRGCCVGSALMDAATALDSIAAQAA